MTHHRKISDRILLIACLPALLTTAGCGLGAPCGGLQGLPCTFGLFCSFETGVCGDGDQTGICLPTPQACTLEYAPVCGCDGVTYGNECGANAAGVSVLSQGECPTNGEVCGGLAGIPCNTGEFCKLPDGQCCCDFQGTCTPIPQACTDEFAPVCGCDAQTYSNECEASSAGVSVACDGPCPCPG